MSDEVTASETSPAPARRLVRRQEGKVFAGVAAGLGDYTGLDPVVFRIGFVVLAVLGFSGVILYLLAWLVIPKDGDVYSPGRRVVRRLSGETWLGLGLVAIAAALFLRDGGFGISPELWALALVAIGILLLMRDRDEPAPVKAAADRSPAEVQLSARDRSPLGWYTLGAVLLVVGLGLMFDNFGALRLQVGDYPAIAMLLVGAGLIVGAWMGRARWLILVGLLLIPPLFVTSLIEVPITGHIGTRYINPERVEDIGEYETLLGALHLDLNDLDLADQRVFSRIEMGIGDVYVWVPRDLRVNLTSEVGFGTVAAPRGRYEDGLNARLATMLGPPDAAGSLNLTIHAGFGSVHVLRGDPDGEPLRVRRHDRRNSKSRGERDRNRRGED